MPSTSDARILEEERTHLQTLIPGGFNQRRRLILMLTSRGVATELQRRLWWKYHLWTVWNRHQGSACHHTAVSAPTEGRCNHNTVSPPPPSSQGADGHVILACKEEARWFPNMKACIFVKDYVGHDRRHRIRLARPDHDDESVGLLKIM